MRTGVSVQFFAMKWNDVLSRGLVIVAVLLLPLSVWAEVTLHTINPGDRIFCSSRIDLGTQPPSLTIFGANTVSTVQQP